VGFGQRQVGSWTATIQKAAPHRIDDGSTGQYRCTGFLGRLIPAAVGIGEQPAIAVVTIALGRRAVGKQDIMLHQFDMIQLHLPCMIIPDDRTVIDQEFRRDQNVVEIE
jgi:hypothetical protein